jgi:hypothetical protein
MRNLKPCGFAIALRILFTMAAPLLTQAATITWTNTAGGNWNAPANWSPNQVPGAADTAMITTPGSYGVSLTDSESVSNLVLGAASGTLTLSISGTFTVKGTGSDSAQSALVISSGALTGSGSIVAGGPLTWTGGNIQCVLICNGGSINVTASSTVGYGGELINTGPLTWTPNGGPLRPDPNNGQRARPPSPRSRLPPLRSLSPRRPSVAFDTTPQNL